MPHFFLQILVNPNAGEDDGTVAPSQVDFAVIPFDPGLVHIKLWGFGTPHQHVVLGEIQIDLSNVSLLLLDGGSGLSRIKQGVVNRVTESGCARSGPGFPYRA